MGNEKDQYSLHFYPDSNKLYVKDGRMSNVDSFDAFGTDQEEVKKGTARYDANTKGTFIICYVGAIQTSNWPLSRIPWGEIVDLRTTDLTFVTRTGKRVKLPNTEAMKAFIQNTVYPDIPKVREAFTQHKTVKVPYRLNDFGPLGIKMFDIKSHKISDHYLHSYQIPNWNRIQGNERKEQLVYSHGCIHMYPSDIETLKNKYIVVGHTQVTVY